MSDTVSGGNRQIYNSDKIILISSILYEYFIQARDRVVETQAMVICILYTSRFLDA